jgi:serine/threonine-protein kinase
MIGSTLDGKYRIVRQLGAGAMGAVYEAEHTGTGRRVAVKVITGQLAQDAGLVSRFQREARAAGAIDTKHITQVLDTGVDRDSALPFMVMEFLSGQDLQQFLKKSGPIAPDLALRIVAQACLGLQKAHEAGVVHRDIKPANLFLARSDGEVIVKVLDFGIAKVQMDQAQETESAGLTRTGNMLGSPLYMSPEQARGSKNIDHRADLWSLGAALYQALSGRTPYQHITALGELIIAICSDPPPPVQQFAPWVPAEVAAIVHGCLRQNPDERFQSAAAMLAAIRPLLPYGWSIQEEMLVPINQAVKEQRASLYSIPPGAPGALTAHPGYGSHPGSGSNPNASSQTGGAGVLVQSQVPVQKPASRTPIVIGAVAVLAFAASAVAFVVTGGARRPAPPEPAQTQAAPAPTPAPTPAPVVPAATQVPIAEPEVDISMRRVKVGIIPPDALVEVEGAAMTTKKGVLEIEGKLGDTFRVRVYKGKYETTQDVIITKDGPNVPTITLSFAPPGTKAQPATTTTPVVPKGVTDKFD